MTANRSFQNWPRVHDKTVVEEMLRNRNSDQWRECHEFVKTLVQTKAKNIPRDQWEDIIQNTMIRLDKSLATFKYDCSIRTWIFGIAHNCIIDFYRKSKRDEHSITPLDNPHGEDEQDEFTVSAPGTVDDMCIIHDELHKALAALLEYASLHSNPKRNRKILNMVIFENRSLEETAQAVGCSAPVAGYVVRSAQRFVREKLEHQR